MHFYKNFIKILSRHIAILLSLHYLDFSPNPINDQCMKISRELAIKILKYCHEHTEFYFPFTVVCQEYTPEDDDFVEVEPEEWETIQEDPMYQTFELWENLHDLREETVELMAKGFIEKMTKGSITAELQHWAQEYRALWKAEFRDNDSIEEFGLNEFFGGKAEGFEEAVEIVLNCSK
jgi:hypothetical protein